MTIETKDGLTIELDEYDVHRWFMAAELDQAIDTHRAVMAIIQTRMALQPKRKRRSDAGQPRPASTASVGEHEAAERTLDLRELGK